ncbi:hypothetical protein WICPIJ_005349 [Wickerhamomyces pijperi]|uniref:Tubulin gamma chain n=1 Tax=Wickerhamomyces pijperi TaxID=599730 RepID=A0A9P8Q648_WICPI|nr:hypothetical protein WICPIJ_005349 [Wickerhamomyces pijperi]
MSYVFLPSISSLLFESILTTHSEIITLQIGKQFWDQLCLEHSISPDGTSTVPSTQWKTRNDETSTFFNSNGDNKYTPRAILIDLEPAVISDIRTSTDHLFDDRNIHVSGTGLGAGNIWTKGYDYADSEIELFTDMIDREMDSCERLEAFQLIHSVGGGTGSGVGSRLLEVMSDRYAKKLLTTYSVFPGETSDVVVQPYNIILTLKRLIENTDANVVIENSKLLSIALDVLQTKSPTITQTNQLISAVMSTATNTLRYPSYTYNSLTSIISTLVPTPDLHFITPSYTPYTSDFVSDTKHFKRPTALDVVVSLLDKKNKMIEVRDKSPEKYISIFNIIQGSYEQTDINKAILRAQQKAQFVSWTPSTIHVTNGKKSQHHITANSNYISGLMLSNTTSITGLLEKSCREFDRLFKKAAFKNNYPGNAIKDEDAEFNDAREIVQGVINEYKAAEQLTYLDDDDEDMGL